MLLELSISVKAGVFNDILIAEMLDPSKRAAKVSFEIMKLYFGCTQTAQALDMQPGRDSNKQQRGNLSEAQFEVVRMAARKLTNHMSVHEALTAKDSSQEGLL